MIRSRSRLESRAQIIGSLLTITYCLRTLAAQGASVSCSIFSLISLTDNIILHLYFTFKHCHQGTLSNIITHVR